MESEAFNFNILSFIFKTICIAGIHQVSLKDIVCLLVAGRHYVY